MSGFRLPRALGHWVAFCGGRPASDGWQPSTRYRVVAGALLVLISAALARDAAQDRGALVGAGVGALCFSGVWFIVTGRIANGSNFAARHPYLDAAWSIPIAAVFAFALLPADWPLVTILAIAVAYVALIFALTWHGTHDRRVRTQI